MTLINTPVGITADVASFALNTTYSNAKNNLTQIFRVETLNIYKLNYSACGCTHMTSRWQCCSTNWAVLTLVYPVCSSSFCPMTVCWLDSHNVTFYLYM